MNPNDTNLRVFDRMAEAVLIRDKNLAIRYCNNAASELFELPIQSLHDRFCHELFGKTCLHCYANCPIDTGPADSADRIQYEAERAVVLPNGKEKILHFRDCFFLPGAKELAALVVEDVTEQRQIQVAYEKSEQRFRTMFSESPVSMWEQNGSELKQYIDELHSRGVSDMQQYFNDNPAEVSVCLAKIKTIHVNQATLQLCEAGSIDELHDNIVKIATPRFLALLASGIAGFAKGKVLFESDTDIVTLLDNKRVVHIKVSVLKDYEQTWGRIIVTMIDITQQVQILEQLRESEEKFASAFRQNPNPLILVTYPERKVIDANEAAFTVIGKCREEIIGTPYPEIVTYQNPEDILKIRELTERDGALHNYEITVRNAAGVSHTGLLSAERIVLNGKTCFLAQFIDISHRINEEHEREALRERVRYLQKIESLSMLAGGIAHDFNNLLGGILGFVELAQLKTPEDSVVGEYLSKIESACKRATVLSKQMLEFSGRGKFTLRSELLTNIVAEARALLSSMIPPNVRIEYDLTYDLPCAEIDRNLLLQILVNLITNSIEAINSQSGVIKVATGKQFVDTSFIKSSFLSGEISEGSYLFLDVTDNGCGMNAETTTRIFDPFFSTKFTGRGLGLPSVLGIVRGHRGAIRVVSKPGKGTAIRVYIPEPQRVDQPKIESVSEAMVEKSAQTVLVIDDEDSIRNVVCRALEISKIDTLNAASGEEGLQLYQQHADKIGLVLLDLTMPGMSGEQVMNTLMQLRSDLRVIISSGFPQQMVMSQFALNKPYAYLQKPFRIGELITAVKSALEQ